ncbi:hypothetical protein Bca4012_102660 [Brassica carinata]
MRDEPKPGYGAQLRANLEPTKGVGRLRQQDGGHGSRTAKDLPTPGNGSAGVQPADCWRLLEPLTWRATASCRPGTDWERSFELSRAEQPTQNCALNVKVKKFNQARFPLSLSTIQLNHSQGNGLGRISGKEDPVELDSSPTL